MKPLLRWWLFISLTIILTFSFYYFGLFAEVWDKDRTKLSFLIMFLFFFTSIHCGKETIKVSNALEGNVSENEIKNIDWRGNQEIGWFISDLVLTIGMIGTVSGFLLMLTGAFAGVDLNDEVAMKNVLEKMSKGMSTALYTTLFGLICGGLLKIQYFSLGRATDILVGPIDKKNKEK
tara:strand:+ start:157 stop:687 length:531 start_codon:yes stop_codon:yes gene_type:complete